MMRQCLLELAEAVCAHLRQGVPGDAEDRALADRFITDLSRLHAARLPEQIQRAEPVRAFTFAPIVFSAQPDPDSAPLFRRALLSFGAVYWTEFYQESSWNRSFLSSFATGEGIGPGGRYLSDEVIFGLFLFGPNMSYPAHAHPAEEFYLVLSGNPEFQVGATRPYVEKEAGAVILHHENVSHALRTGMEPCFGIYGWRGKIAERSWYKEDMTDESEARKFLARA